MYRTKRIYLAGGIQKFFDNDKMTEAKNWREEIAELYKDNDEIQIIDPVKLFEFRNDYSLGKERIILEQELELIQESDLVVAYFNDPKSLGTMSEITAAYVYGVPVVGVTNNIYSCVSLHTWQKLLCKYLIYWDEVKDVIDYAIK